MTTLHVYDPAMCCSTGVCGPSVDPRLARFAADLDWLRSQGVAVTRYNLAQQPAAFAADAAVRRALEELGDEALPLIAIDGAVRSTGLYATRDELASWVGISAVDARRAVGVAQAAQDAPAEPLTRLARRATLATVDTPCCTPTADGADKGGCC